MKSWLEQQPEQVRQSIEYNFINFSNFEAMTRFGNQHQRSEKSMQKKSVSYHDIYMLAQGREIQPLSQINRALLETPSLNRAFKSLLRQFSLAVSPKVAAASSGVLRERHAEGFTLILKPSNADSEQIYIQIRLTRPYKRLPSLIILRGANDEMICFNLPKPVDHVYQWLHSADSELVRAIADKESELFLC